MARLSDARTLGWIGSLLAVLTIVPTVGWILGIIGFIMMMIAVKYISEIVQDRAIFNNFIITVVAYIVGIAIAGLFIITIFWPMAINIGMGGITPTIDEIIALMVPLAISLVVVWIAFIIASIFLRRSFGAISSKLQIGMFSTAALLYLIGAILTIVIFGFVLIWIAEILFIVAFYQISDVPPQTLQPTQAATTAPPPPPPATTAA